MASAGDSGLEYIGGNNVSSDGAITGWSFTGIPSDYLHIDFKVRAAFDGSYAYPFASRVNLGDGSVDTGYHYNRGVSWGYHNSRFSFGDSRQPYGQIGTFPATDPPAGVTDGHLGIIEGTLWNYSDANKYTAITFDSFTMTDGTVSSYNYWYWGWMHYRQLNVVDHFQIAYPGWSLKQNSRFDLWGWVR